MSSHSSCSFCSSSTTMSRRAIESASVTARVTAHRERTRHFTRGRPARYGSHSRRGRVRACPAHTACGQSTLGAADVAGAGDDDLLSEVVRIGVGLRWRRLVLCGCRCRHERERDDERVEPKVHRFPGAFRLTVRSARDAYTWGTSSCGRQRDFRLDGAAAAGFALEEERAAELANALAHVDEAHASGVAGAAGDEPDAVVADGQANDASGAGEPDADLRRLRVLRDVAERLLRDAVE